MTFDVPRADPLLLPALLADFEAANYTIDGVAELLGESGYAALNREQFGAALLSTERSESALATLIRFFLLARPVSIEKLEAALPRLGVVGLGSLGLAETVELAETAGTECRVLADLRPYAFQDEQGEVRLWVCSDLAAHQSPGVLRRDHVLGIGGASLSLAQATIRKPMRRALDLGCGCGIQTLHLLRHAEHVTATDISERALGFTRFNLLLNAAALGLDAENLNARVELRLGSLLQPVAGEEFDLVVSNPPFVITPRHPDEAASEQFTYRDGGLPGDELVSSLIQGLPRVLAEAGSAQLLGNWEIPRSAASWQQRLEPWFADDLDYWLIQREQLSPEQYAETWLQDASQGREPEGYASVYREYLLDFEARQIASIGFGMLWLRRSVSAGSSSRLRRMEGIDHPIEQPIGPALAASIERHDWLSASTAEDLDAAKLLVAEDVTEERHQRPGAEHPGVILLRQGAGLRRTTLLSTELAGFVSACDGTLSVGQIIAALEALLGRGLELREEIRQLILDGFLIPDQPS
ncbi:DUF7059 domain-containing protein [Psychromicrobium lacuslunae]|uniref:SAM-dependent methyltransferase n=1 Tax=Psychromicrobium lacuslunae TaxID=1618207 RepID=A0A0D4C031_9MICC|nr:methyltransferase [Psychromicrobium lacuslunae]AJT41943.1 SAM-dependent methyltransferase [Psychromicrobium lacuslunae]